MVNGRKTKNNKIKLHAVYKGLTVDLSAEIKRMEKDFMQMLNKREEG